MALSWYVKYARRDYAFEDRLLAHLQLVIERN